MMSLRPTVEEERWLTLAARLGAGRDTPWVTAHIGAWTMLRARTRAMLFVFACITAALTAIIFSLLHVPMPLLVAGLALVAVAECLILCRHLFKAGIEEGLEVAGLLMLTQQLLPASGAAQGIYNSLLIAAALASPQVMVMLAGRSLILLQSVT